MKNNSLIYLFFIYRSDIGLDFMMKSVKCHQVDDCANAIGFDFFDTVWFIMKRLT